MMSVFSSCSPENFGAVANPGSGVTTTPTPGTGILCAVTCSPTVNGGTSATVTPGGANPTVAANCTPSDGSYVWTVTTNGSPVIVPNLVGSTAIPSFSTEPQGTYLINLNAASSTNCTAYVSNSPLTVYVGSGPTPTPTPGYPTPTPTPSPTPQTITQTVTEQNNMLDILVIVDDSYSMLDASQRLAARMSNLTGQLQSAGFNWQMCITVTNALQLNENDPTLYWGASINWTGNTSATPWILNPSVPNYTQVFTNTINAIGAGWANTEDERPIKSAWWHLWNGDPTVQGTSGCYRNGNTGLAVIIISNEDERSIAGDKSQQVYPDEYYPLDNDDYPTTYIDYVQQVFGTQKRFTVNSILVEPGDTSCKAIEDATGRYSHYGTLANELSGLTSGYAGSICASDYTSNMNFFASSIINSMNSINLGCTPYGTPTYNTVPTFQTTLTVSGQSVVFNPALPVGTTVTVTYQCVQ